MADVTRGITQTVSATMVRRVRADGRRFRVRTAPVWARERIVPDKVVRGSIPCAAMVPGRLLR
jgi:hypothetical protein